MVRLRIGGPDRRIRSLTKKLGGIRRNLIAGARMVKDARPAWRELRRSIDRRIAESFTTPGRWAPLSVATTRQRSRRAGWYKQNPRFTSSIGRWTAKMYRGLLARPGSLGNNLITKQRYVRSYQERETYMGKEVGGRASWFLYGRRATGLGGPQPARPAWPRLWREQQARLAVFRHFNRAGRLMRGEA